MEKSNKSRRQSTPIDPSYGHLQPQALDIERVVLGALMIDKDAFSVVSEIIRPESFYEPRNQKIYQAIQTLNMSEKPVDFMTVIEELKHQGDLDSVGGPTYIVELTSRVASSAHIEYHAHILAQKFLARQLISFTSNIQEMAFDETLDPGALMQEAEGQLFEISQKNMKTDYTQIDPVIKHVTEMLQIAATNSGGMTGVPTGYTKLDEYTSGWQKGDLVIFGGRAARKSPGHVGIFIATDSLAQSFTFIHASNSGVTISRIDEPYWAARYLGARRILPDFPKEEKAERELAGVQKRFIQAQQRLRDETMRNQQQLSDLESKLLKGQASDLKKKITTFASKNGYDLILDSAAAIFHSKDLDVTDAVLKEMGVDPKAAREKMKNEGK